MKMLLIAYMSLFVMSASAQAAERYSIHFSSRSTVGQKFAVSASGSRSQQTLIEAADRILKKESAL